jgi:HK97 family phage major capsid protein
MTESELLKKLEEAVGKSLTEADIPGLVDAKLAAHLKAVDEKAVKAGLPAPSKAEEKSATPFFDTLRGIYDIAKGVRDTKSAKFVSELATVKALNYEGSDTAGGYMVPVEQANRLLDMNNNYSVLPGLCVNLPMASKTLTFPTISGTTAYWIPEATDTTFSSQATGKVVDSAATVGQVSLTAHMLNIAVPVSLQLLEDSNPAIEAALMRVFAGRMWGAVDTAMINGAGSTTDPITGIDDRITTNVYPVGAEFNYDDIIDLMTPRDNAGNVRLDLVAHSKGIRKTMKIKDDNGQYIYAGPTSAGAPPTLWGMNLYEDGNVETTQGGGGNETSIFCGAFSTDAFLGVRQGISIFVDPYSLALGNQVRFIVRARFGFTVSNENRFAKLTGLVV